MRRQFQSGELASEAPSLLPTLLVTAPPFPLATGLLEWGTGAPFGRRTRQIPASAFVALVSLVAAIIGAADTQSVSGPESPKDAVRDGVVLGRSGGEYELGLGWTWGTYGPMMLDAMPAGLGVVGRSLGSWARAELSSC